MKQAIFVPLAIIVSMAWWLFFPDTAAAQEPCTDVYTVTLDFPVAGYNPISNFDVSGADYSGWSVAAGNNYKYEQIQKTEVETYTGITINNWNGYPKNISFRYKVTTSNIDVAAGYNGTTQIFNNLVSTSYQIKNGTIPTTGGSGDFWIDCEYHGVAGECHIDYIQIGLDCDAITIPPTPTPTPTPTPVPVTCDLVDNYNFSTSANWSLEGTAPGVIEGGFAKMTMLDYLYQTDVILQPHSNYVVTIDVYSAEWWNNIDPLPDFAYDEVGLNVALLGGGPSAQIWFDSAGVYTASISTLNVANYTLNIDTLAEVSQEIWIDSVCLELATEDGLGNEQVNCIFPSNGDFSSASPSNNFLPKDWTLHTGAFWSSATKDVFLPLSLSGASGLAESSLFTLPAITGTEKLLLRYKTWNEHGGEGRTGVALYDDPGDYFETLVSTSYTPYTYEFNISAYAGNEVQVLATNPGIEDETFGLYGDNSYLDDVCIFISGRNPAPPEPEDPGAINPIVLIDNRISSCSDMDAIWAGFGVNMAQARATFNAGPSIWDPIGWVPWLVSSIVTSLGDLSCWLMSSLISLLKAFELVVNNIANIAAWLKGAVQAITNWAAQWGNWLSNSLRNIYTALAVYVGSLFIWLGLALIGFFGSIKESFTAALAWIVDTWADWWLWIEEALDWLYFWQIGWLFELYAWLLDNLSIIYDIYNFIIAVFGMLWLLIEFVWTNIIAYGALPLQFYYGFDQSFNSAAYNPLVSCANVNFWCTFLAGVQLINQAISHSILYPIVIVAIILSTVAILWRDVTQLFSQS
jgi:hypothetical protein